MRASFGLARDTWMAVSIRIRGIRLPRVRTDQGVTSPQISPQGDMKDRPEDAPKRAGRGCRRELSLLFGESRASGCRRGGRSTGGHQKVSGSNPPSSTFSSTAMRRAAHLDRLKTSPAHPTLHDPGAHCATNPRRSWRGASEAGRGNRYPKRLRISWCLHFANHWPSGPNRRIRTGDLRLQRPSWARRGWLEPDFKRFC
jgi:hypothetical protein